MKNQMIRREKAIDRINAAMIRVESKEGEKINLMKLAESLENACQIVDYESFIGYWLSKGKQLKTGQNLLKKGNDKLHNSIGIWNMPAIFTCPNCKDCGKACYAFAPQTRYPSCRKSRFVNLLIAMYYPKELVLQVVRQIRVQKISAVRIHESGDFYSELYAGIWVVIAEMTKRSNPETKFYFYTKSDNTDALAALENVNRVESILPDGSINFGPIEYCKAKAEKFGIEICPVTKEKNNDIECGNHCKKCTSHRFMLFVQHSG
jgi:hypothetical protein